MVNFLRELSAGEKLQDMEQHLGQKLLYSTLELEKLKAEAREEMRKNKEYVNQLIHLLKLAIQERDEARNQVHKLLNKSIPSQTTESFPLFQADSPLVIPGKANSSVTESNSLLETYNNYQSHGSSPVDSLFDGVSSPEFSSINLVANQSLVQDPNAVPQIDHGSLIIDNIAKGRDLPKRGKFLQLVLEAGPLLQTLLVAGPLPRWRNPPQLQPFQVPPVSIKGCDAEVFTQKQAQLPYKSTQVISAPVLNFNVPLLSSGANANGYVPLGKRQRFC